jgi:hypothetical protein
VQVGLKNFDAAVNYYKKALEVQPGELQASELLRQAQADKVRTLLPQDYAAIATSPQVTRGDVAAMLMVELMLESRLPAPTRISIISDITTHWAKSYIIKVVQYGIMTLPPDRDFRPNEPIQKGEFAAVLDALFQKLNHPLLDGSSVQFTDVSADNDYSNAVLRVCGAGLMSASTGSNFGILDPLSGAEATQIFEKIKTMMK